MILCLKCWRLWPRGTMYCGRCGGSLGKRVCSDGHESHLKARYCSLCGSSKLSRGAPCRSLRPLTWMGALCLASIAWHGFALPAWHNLYAMSIVFLVRAFDFFLWLAVWSWIVGLILGEQARRLLSTCWMGLIRIFLSVLSSIAKIAWSLIRQKLPK
jgi:RNA polymerase subunit RPABC4/transcription elongation factor Spt4